MLLLILGADERTLPLLQTLQQDAGAVRVVGWYDSDAVGDSLAQACPQGNRFGSVEEFAGAVTGEVVVVVGGAGEPSEKEKLLRDLARDGIPLTLDQPACSGIFAVELDMIQRDTQAPMVPYHPPSHHPVFARLAQWTRGTDSPVGPVEQVVMERSMEDRSDAAVRAALARDAILLRRLLGKFQQVGAMSAKGVTSLTNLSVQLTGESKAVGRWSVTPVTERQEATLTLIGTQGRITLLMPDAERWTLESSGAEPPSAELPPVDPQVLCDEMHAALQGQSSIPSWEDAFRSIDVADLASESARRGKTLSVSNARLTEEDTFKGLMAAVGCLIIMVIPFLLLLVSLLDGLEISRQRKAKLSVLPGQREITLPGDVVSVDTVQLTGDQSVLPSLTRRQLLEQHGRTTQGKPAAYSLSRNSITIGPAADEQYELELVYRGKFRIWRGWPLLLLSPIALFLLLQLLKLAFPKSPAPDATAAS